MKNKIIGFIIALVLIVLTSATTITVMTVKPATPSSTIVFTDYGDLGSSIDLVVKAGNFVRKYSKYGYITKSITFGSYETRAVIIVMEKY